MISKCCLAVLGVLALSSGAIAQIDYNFTHPQGYASYRDYGLYAGHYFRDGDEDMVYAELPSAYGPASLYETFQYTTEDGDTGIASVQFQSDANGQGMQFTGTLTAAVVGNSPEVLNAYATAHNDHHWMFRVSEPTTLKIEGALTVLDNASGSEAFLSLVRDDDVELLDVTADAANPVVDLTGANALSVELEPGQIYFLLLQALAYNSYSTPGTGGVTSFSFTATVPEPTGIAGVALAATLLGRRRQR